MPPRDSPPEQELAPQSSDPAREDVDAIARLVAHAINNPLAALVMDLELAMELLRADDSAKSLAARAQEVGELLVQARTAADRVHLVVENLSRSTSAADAIDLLSGQPPLAIVAPRTATGARVLVVDDDILVGNALRRTLRGYEVVVLGTAVEALELLRIGERYDLILCDLIMPELTGMDLHAAILELDPEQAERMIFLTGGAVTTRAREFVATTNHVVIEKPFDVKHLRQVVEERIK
jgi:CheY-like chemotaxis protein